jgi:hypothetical protein
MEGYQEYRKWMDSRARKDLNSAKLLLDKTSDIGNAIFLLEQSYEKILKIAYVYCETRVFGKDFLETLNFIYRHENSIIKVLTILPELLRGFNNSVSTLKDRVSHSMANGDIDLNGAMFVMIVLPLIPTPRMKSALQRKFEQISKTDSITSIKSRKLENYDEWVKLCQIIRQKQIPLDEINRKFEEAYANYNIRIVAAFENPNNLKQIVRDSTMFITLATALSPLTLAYKYARYPTSKGNFKNLEELDGHSTSMRDGLYVVHDIISKMFEQSDSFMRLLGDYKRSDRNNEKWKRKMGKTEIAYR